ncbi:hypothetical protein [Pseudomonas aeruginosa]|uniref:hypothetical protein n=1 Tax=Pseudomonas aeruginosa TaxID=287 RepID=UPI0025B2413F|nr:hypothetical protein [Pseudomonas aeruginosa]MDN2540113.1 hypothetical protein [Pseudomonas aeruginosa]MDN2545446.1 hypothetical protein [Pseudomonas aeruginosa]MDN2551201.1 hypothetical protein [Pseudomonas aeruginosa]
MPLQRAAPRKLTEQQLKNPLIRAAHERLGNIVSLRGKYLRRLDTVHGDRRTRLEKFQAIERVEEQLLVRLDLATGVLGYIDAENGRFVLNTQCNIAADAGISAPVLSRLLATLDDASYVYRRIERVRLEETDENGLHLVRTRVLVRFTKQFWADLGLRYVYERVQKAAKKRREAELRELGQRRLAEMERHSLELHRREVSRQRWQAKEARKNGMAPPEPSATDSQPQTTTKATGQSVQSALDRLMANKPTGSG